MYGVVFYRAIPHFLQNSSNSFLQNSPPLSILNTFIFFFVWFSTRALNYLNMSNTLDFFLKKYIHVLLENSSINETYYTYLVMEPTQVQTHHCAEALISCFPSKHHKENSIDSASHIHNVHRNQNLESYYTYLLP